MFAAMKRLTISGDACIETLALLITMAWADGHLEDQEKAGVRAAAGVFNLTKELRDRLEELLTKPLGVDELLLDELSARDKAFAYVAAAWLSGVDQDVHEKEQALLDQVASRLGFTAARRTELAQIARDLEPLRKGDWTNEIVSLFRAIPARLEGDGNEAVEVAFE
jgi:uncharacterized membrane protein YebE (DUF533 family)